STQEVEVLRPGATGGSDAHLSRGQAVQLEHSAADERGLAWCPPEIAYVVRVAWDGHHIAEKVLVPKRAKPAKDVFCLQDVDPVAKRDSECELIDVQRDGSLSARVEEPADAGTYVAREIFPYEVDDRIDVARLEPSNDGILEAKAELIQQSFEALRDLRGG